MSDYLFTVFTPTFDRAHVLGRVHDSLVNQTFRDFEWVIVDDGSTDDTAKVVETWKNQNLFPLRYFRQENQGKHVAFNRGVREAKGELFLTLDSDDSCVPTALERLRFHWMNIPEGIRGQFSAVTALCLDQKGNPVGGRFPGEFIDSDSLEIRYKYGVSGEKWGFQRTDVLRQFPFPEDLKGTYVPEGLVWNSISRDFKTRYVNERLRIYWIEGPSMVHGHTAVKNACGGRLQHLTCLNTELDWFRYAPLEFLRSAVHYTRFAHHCGVGLLDQVRALTSPWARVLWTLALPLGTLVFLRDLRRERRS